MSTRWVVDASLALSWVHPHQATDKTDALLQRLKDGVNLVVPALWFLEVANALLVLERRRRIRGDERREALAALQALNLTTDSSETVLTFGRVSDLAEKHKLSVYDATYLELALREHLPLGTTDAALRQAARAARVKLLLRG